MRFHTNSIKYIFPHNIFGFISIFCFCYHAFELRQIMECLVKLLTVFTTIIYDLSYGIVKPKSKSKVSSLKSPGFGLQLTIQAHEKVTVSFRILGFFFNLEYFHQFFLKFKKHGQFQNPYDEQISKLSLIFIICRKLIEIFKVKDKDLNPK